MYDEVLKNLEYISKTVGNPVEYTQGGGGNTSAKLDGELMAVKASGYKLKQITPKEGYVVVNYRDIIDFYKNVDDDPERDYEKESTEFIKSRVIDTEGLKKLRPSVEAGFHSFLKKYVIHTHSVYANMICCTANGAKTVHTVFGDCIYGTSWIPYINPGFHLSLKIAEAVRGAAEIHNEKYPDVIFMENHGLIVTADDPQRCVELHTDVNTRIKRYLGITEGFPEIELFTVDDNTIISRTGYIREQIRSGGLTPDFFDETVLYPDQLVYLNGNISMDKMDRKLNINSKTGEIIYKTGLQEAQTIEETLLAYLYVINGIRKSGMPIKTMSRKEADFIRNWESEAYRKRLAAEAGK